MPRGSRMDFLFCLYVGKTLKTSGLPKRSESHQGIAEEQARKLSGLLSEKGRT
jgi:hypothetical protein